jgi:hypothetical protein
MSQIKIAIGLTRGSHANERHIRVPYAIYGISGSPQLPGLLCGSYNFINLRFDNWRFATINKIHFDLSGIDTYYIMPIVGEARSRHGTYIT